VSRRRSHGERGTKRDENAGHPPQTLTEIAAEKNSTIIFPLPLELLQGFLRLPTPAPRDVNGNVPHVPTPSHDKG
jgi:hypothetical protein